MVSMIIGLLLIAFTVIAALPSGLGWTNEILAFIKGGAPVFSAFIGLVAIFVGIADIRDKQEAKREEQQSREKDE